MFGRSFTGLTTLAVLAKASKGKLMKCKNLPREIIKENRRGDTFQRGMFLKQKKNNLNAIQKYVQHKKIVNIIRITLKISLETRSATEGRSAISTRTKFTPPLVQ